MGASQKIWDALTTIIQMESRVREQEGRSREQQAKIEDLTGRIIRLEAQMDMLRGYEVPAARLISVESDGRQD